MWEKYWLMYYEIKADSCYYQQYAVSSRNLKWLVSALCLFSTSATVYAWFQQFGRAQLWPVLALVFQVITVLQPLFPYESQNRSACYIAQDLEALLVEIELSLYGISGTTTDAEIAGMLSTYRREYEQIVNRFSRADTFTKSRRIMKKAEKEAREFIDGRRKYYVQPETCP